jgi:hypothetical protein
VLFSTMKLHALVEYESSDIADKAVSKFLKNFRLKMQLIPLLIQQ